MRARTDAFIIWWHWHFPTPAEVVSSSATIPARELSYPCRPVEAILFSLLLFFPFLISQPFVWWTQNTLNVCALKGTLIYHSAISSFKALTLQWNFWLLQLLSRLIETPSSPFNCHLNKASVRLAISAFFMEHQVFKGLNHFRVKFWQQKQSWNKSVNKLSEQTFNRSSVTRFIWSIKSQKNLICEILATCLSFRHGLTTQNSKSDIQETKREQ